MAEPDLSLDALFQVNMPVRDLPKAVAFYRDVLRLPLHVERPGLAFFSAGSVRLLVEGVAEEGGRYAHPGSVLYFPVADIQQAYRELQARGVQFVEGPSMVSASASEETWMAFFDDGDWNTHAIVARVPLG
jgi:predicted enzyme related to lactoylglutathione lyase